MPTEELFASPLAGKRILIVEDEGITQLQLRKILLRAGLDVIGSAANGKEGVEMALQEKPDLILMDITMPVMDGLQATKQIVAQLSPCIMILTAYTDEEYRQAAQKRARRGISPSRLLPKHCCRNSPASTRPTAPRMPRRKQTRKIGKRRDRHPCLWACILQRLSLLEPSRPAALPLPIAV